MTSVLVLHPGDMGSSLAQCLQSQNHEISWVEEGRSQATQLRAIELGLLTQPTLTAALSQVAVVVSICPPEFAVEVATEVNDCGFDGIFVDANATSPMTAEEIYQIFGAKFVDGSVIGPPANQSHTTRLYLSGEQADFIQGLFEGSFCAAITLGERSGAASALKMCYAAYTKGTSALLINICSLAEKQGVFEALKSEWQISQKELEARCQRLGPSVSRKAWRFEGEMREIASTFAQNNLPSGFHEGAADLYSLLAQFKDLPPAPTSDLVHSLTTRR